MTDGAWLSSARAVRCQVKSCNERNPCLQLLTGNAEDSKETDWVTSRKVGTTSNHHASYEWGNTRATMDGTKRSNMVTWSKPQKTVLSSD